MPAESPHHKSKKRRYDLLLVPSDDAGEARQVRVTPWQLLLLSGGSVIIIVITVLLILVYTPIGLLVPIPNPELENRYSKELLSLNERMNVLLRELVVLREYNLKLRNALGEKVVMSDSGLVATGTLRQPVGNETKREDLQRSRPLVVLPGVSKAPSNMVVAQEIGDRRQVVVFPAIFPTEGYVTRGFDVERRHYGLDIAGKMGTPVNAAADGNVVFAGWTNEDGYVVIISHSGGYLTFYKHNQSLLKSAGVFVRRGEPIALLGNSGETSSGPHVHFEIWKDGTAVDPSQYFLNMHF